MAEVRAAVLALRRGKGMVIDPADADSVSAGSFFMNPVLDPEAFAALEARARARLGAGARVPRFPQADGTVKTSAAWLIERAGFARGHGDPAPSRSPPSTRWRSRTGARARPWARGAGAGDRGGGGGGVRRGLEPEPVFVGHAWRAPDHPSGAREAVGRMRRRPETGQPPGADPGGRRATD